MGGVNEILPIEKISDRVLALTAEQRR